MVLFVPRFRCERGDDFLEVRIAAERIEHGIEFKNGDLLVIARTSSRRKTATAWHSLRLLLAQLLKARIIADLIPDRIKPQQRRSNRMGIRYLQQPLENGNRVVGISQ